MGPHSWAGLVLECSIEGLRPSDFLKEGSPRQPRMGRTPHTRDGFHCADVKHVLEMYGCCVFYFVWFF